MAVQEEQVQETLVPVEILRNLEVEKQDIILSINAGNVTIEKDQLTKLQLGDEVSFVVQAKISKVEAHRKNRGRRDAGRQFTRVHITAKADSAEVSKHKPSLKPVPNS